MVSVSFSGASRRALLLRPCGPTSTYYLHQDIAQANGRSLPLQAIPSSTRRPIVRPPPRAAPAPLPSPRTPTDPPLASPAHRAAAPLPQAGSTRGHLLLSPLTTSPAHSNALLSSSLLHPLLQHSLLNSTRTHRKACSTRSQKHGCWVFLTEGMHYYVT
jgi:hypothetical protein